MRGQAKTFTGDNVTVCFSLAIRRASFELTVLFDGSGTGPSKVAIKKVAHLPPLSKRHKVSDTLSLEKTKGSDRSIGGSGAAGMHIEKISAKMGVMGKLARGSKSKTSRKRRISGTTLRNNVTATLGGNIVHWEITPTAELFEGCANVDLTEWLEGDVFRTPNGGPLDACIASWKRDESRGPPVITGSVFTSMSDLIIREIRLLTDLGEDVPIKKVEQASVPPFGLFTSDAKERLVKQIVRKHLSSQGMSTEGARVEICKASA